MMKKLWQHLSKKRRTQFLLLLILMLIASVMEVVSIGAVVPFLGALTSPEAIFKYAPIQPVIKMLKFTEANQLLLRLNNFSLNEYEDCIDLEVNIMFLLQSGLSHCFSNRLFLKLF